MRRKTAFEWTAAAFLAGACSSFGEPEPVLKRATEGVFSSDGRRLAFQQELDGHYAVGILSLEDGAVEWVEKSAGQACHPAWTSDGGLVYTACGFTGTAYCWFTNQTDVGYNLWLWRDGKKRRLTSGRCFDTTPGVSPDSSTVYFASDRSFASTDCCGSEGNMSMFSLSLTEQESKPKAVRTIPGDASGAAVSQPQVSPDGRYLVWAEQANYWENWCLKAARVATPNDCCVLTPPKMPAYGPRWTPDGRHVLFTGYQAGDPGWCVYALEPRSGALRRLCEGREGALAPDGRRLAYETAQGGLVIRNLKPSAWPSADVARTVEVVPTEQVLWSGTEPARDTRIPLDPAFVSGKDDVLFVRVEIEIPAKLPGFEHFFVGSYAESDTGFQLYLTGGKVWFASRMVNDDYVGANTEDAVLKSGFRGTITGVRTPTEIVIQINDEAPCMRRINGCGMALKTPQTFHVGHPQKEGLSSRPFSGKIHRLEYGTGWPKNVKRPLTAKEVFE